MHYLDTINEYQSQGMLTIDGKLKLGKALGDGLEHREFYADAASIEQIVKKIISADGISLRQINNILICHTEFKK